MLQTVYHRGRHRNRRGSNLSNEVRAPSKCLHCDLSSIVKRRIYTYQALVVDKNPLTHVAILKIGPHGFVCGNFAVEFDHGCSHRCEKHITGHSGLDIHLTPLRRYQFDTPTAPCDSYHSVETRFPDQSSSHFFNRPGVGGKSSLHRRRPAQCRMNTSEVFEKKTDNNHALMALHLRQAWKAEDFPRPSGLAHWPWSAPDGLRRRPRRG